MVMAGAAALWCAAPLAVGCAATAGAARARAGAAARARAWQAAIELPGMGALNKGGNADVNSLSCASAGNCAAGGYYTNGSGHHQAFVASQTNGTWHAATEVPSLAALNKGGNADVVSVSCGSAGNCLAGGFYVDRSRHKQAFVASEANGAWQAAIELPGTGALNKGGNADVVSVSCASSGNCAAGGYYQDGQGHYQALVASEASGTWHAAIKVRGTGFAEVYSVSCASAGNCLAGGHYGSASSGAHQAFVASEIRGAWHAAIEVPGTARLNKGLGASVVSVSCASAGNCAAGGSFTDDIGRGQAFVASETNGTWHAAIEVPGAFAVNTGGGAEVDSVSCASAGNCAAGGSYTNGQDQNRAFVASEVNGTWHAAIDVPGIGALSNGNALGNSVSCASAGNCAVGGLYGDRSGHGQAFVAGEANGTWQASIEVPGTRALNKGGNASVTSVSCAPAGSCVAGGYYADSSGHLQAFVASQS
jgi:hypothetical protein